MENFYPSISLNLFNEAIQYASTITEISDSDKATIQHSRKTLLFHNNKPWEMKSGDPDFDLPMGCYDGAEICELVGIFILNKLSNIIDKNSIGLYRDDGLGMLDKLSGPQIEQKKKKIIKFSKDCGLPITLTTNITSAEFLDLTLHLKTEFHQLFRKPNNDPIYIGINSNHPPQILKQLPKSISERSSENSSSKEVFDKSKTLYQKSLNNSGFYENLIYHQGNGNKNQHTKIKKRQRQIIWFNSPFQKIVKTNIGKKFFKFINRHFSKHPKMLKIFNKNTTKLSYICCKNMGPSSV